MTAVNAAWDGIIVNLERDIANRKAGVLEARDERAELERAYPKRIGELTAYIDQEVDQIAALQSMLEHARRQRDGDPLVAAIEEPAMPDHPTEGRTADGLEAG